MQTKQFHVRLKPDEAERLRALANSFRLSDTSLAAILLVAAIEAVTENSGQVTLPAHFRLIQNDPYVLARAEEKPTRYRK